MKGNVKMGTKTGAPIIKPEVIVPKGNGKVVMH